jgi:hypothetical protein
MADKEKRLAGKFVECLTDKELIMSRKDAGRVVHWTDRQATLASCINLWLGHHESPFFLRRIVGGRGRGRGGPGNDW